MSRTWDGKSRITWRRIRGSTSKTLFVVWGGANDVLNATSPTQVINAAIQETLDIQRLIAAGATQILVLNLPPWA